MCTPVIADLPRCAWPARPEGAALTAEDRFVDAEYVVQVRSGVCTDWSSFAPPAAHDSSFCHLPNGDRRPVASGQALPAAAARSRSPSTAIPLRCSALEASCTFVCGAVIEANLVPDWRLPGLPATQPAPRLRAGRVVTLGAGDAGRC